MGQNGLPFLSSEKSFCSIGWPKMPAILRKVNSISSTPQQRLFSGKVGISQYNLVPSPYFVELAELFYGFDFLSPLEKITFTGNLKADVNFRSHWASCDVNESKPNPIKRLFIGSVETISSNLRDIVSIFSVFGSVEGVFPKSYTMPLQVEAERHGEKLHPTCSYSISATCCLW